MLSRSTRRAFALYFSLLLACLLLGGLLWLYPPITHAQSLPDALGTVRGTVRNTEGVPLPNVKVSLFNLYPFGSDIPIRTATTNAQGAYGLLSIPPGSYRVKFEDHDKSYGTTYYDNQIFPTDATLLSVGGTEITGIDAVLSLGGSISITAQFPVTSNYYILVPTLYRRDALGYWAMFDSLDWPYSDPELAFYALPVGVYRLCYAGYIAPYPYTIDRCYNDIPRNTTASPPTDATDIVVNAGAQTQITLTIGEYEVSQLQGTVVTPEGKPLADAQLAITGIGNNFSDFVITDFNGRFFFGPLANNTYTLSAYHSSYAPTYYDRAAVLADATKLQIDQNSRYSLTVEMLEAGKITGRIRVQGGAFPNNLSFGLYTRLPDGTWGDGAIGCQPYACGFAYTPNTGMYTVTGLATGVYRLQATEWSPTYYQLSGFYGGHNLETANDIAVTTGHTTANINFELAHGRFDGAITGAATANGTPQAGLDVGLFVPDTFAPARPYLVTVTDAQGNYRFDGLPGGHYYIGVYDPAGKYALNFYGGNPFQPATVVITGAHTVGNVNIALTPGSTIRGRITRWDNQGVVGFQLHVYPQSGWYELPFIHATADAQGNYAITGLPPGAYRIGVTSPECCLPDNSVRFYPRGYPDWGAGTITLGEGVVVSGINIPYDGQAGAFLPLLGAQ